VLPGPEQVHHSTAGDKMAEKTGPSSHDWHSKDASTASVCSKGGTGSMMFRYLIIFMVLLTYGAKEKIALCGESATFDDIEFFMTKGGF